MISKDVIKKTIPRFLKKPIAWVYYYSLFLKDYFTFKKLFDGRFPLTWKNRYPQIFDKTSTTNFDAHYIYHPAWAARIVKKINPEFHTDISSTLTFSSMLSAFIPIKFYDYRPANLTLDNLESKHADLQNLPFKDGELASLSCMHTVEHIGLGRYGDPIDPRGDLKAIGELKRVLAPGGDLLFVVPIGKPRIMFNAHRIYSYEQIMSYFSDLHLEEFSLIPDNAQKIGMVFNTTKELTDHQKYGCGCFWFKKK
jgi:SAM-dependent methyltransferase